MARAWYCVHTKPHNEEFAVGHLARLGLHILFPQYTHPSTRRAHALFPCYVFVNFDHEIAPWRKIYSTPGVKHLFMRSPERPLEIPQTMIDLIEQQVAECQREDSLRPQNIDLQPGDSVLINSDNSPFYQMEGTFTHLKELSGRQRVEILLSIFGRMCSVEFDAADVKKKSNAKTDT